MEESQLVPTHPNTEYCADLETGIADYAARGYRLDMVSPADAPTIALVSKAGNVIRLQVHTPAREQGRRPQHGSYVKLSDEDRSSDGWIKGRAGMEYRDLLPGRLDGRLIASHIRLTKGGEVADYVHYHKIRFQMIHCIAGAIKVVYEDQGPPFWLLPGDCVLQPPEIRHRVLEAEAGSEVIELGVPAVHETWVEHETPLPTPTLDPTRDFGGQIFVRHIAATADQTGTALRSSVSVTAIGAATRGLADVRVIHLSSVDPYVTERTADDGYLFLYCLEGDIEIETAGKRTVVDRGSALVVPPGASLRSSTESASVLAVALSEI